MRKTAVFLLAACLMLSGLMSGTAACLAGTLGGTVITVEVPSTHTLYVDADGASVSYNGESGTSFEVPRLDEFTLTVTCAGGYVITGVFLDGEDVTSSLNGETLTLSGIHEAAELTVATAVVTGSTTISGVLYDLPDQDFPEESFIYKVAVEVSGLTEVPEELQGIESLNSLEKISEVMKSVLIGQCGYPEANMVIYEVTLVVSADQGETWEVAEAGHFPEDGLKVVLPYPDGTAKDTHDFAATHMFTSTAFGKTPGGTESPAVTKTDNGLMMTLTGLSPVAIAWTEVEMEAESSESGSTETEAAESTESTEPTEDTEADNGSDGDSDSPGTTGQSGSSGDSGIASVIEAVEGAVTGDSGMMLLWIALLAVACCMTMAAYLGRKKNTE